MEYPNIANTFEKTPTFPYSYSKYEHKLIVPKITKFDGEKKNNLSELIDRIL